jgi:nitrite reductase (NO-forming)
MPSFPLTDQDIANVLTFVYNSFGNSGLAVTPAEVKTIRSRPLEPTAPASAHAAPAAPSAFE